VPSSVDAFASLLNGSYDILTATFDNALNYRLVQNKTVTVLGQLDQGPDLVIASVPSISNVSQLLGKPLMVDSASSGYTYLLQHILSVFDLTLADGDFSFQVVGGTPTRYADLVAGALPNGSDVFATIITYPYTLQGASLPTDQALNILARVSDYIAPITSTSFMARDASVSSPGNSTLLARFMASMLAANEFLLTPKNANCSIAAIAAIAAQLGVTGELAAREYASAVDAVSGEVSPPTGNFTVNKEGTTNDVNVRKAFGGFTGLSANYDFAAALEPGAGKLIDYSVRDAAVRLYEENRAVLGGNCSGRT